MSGIPGLRAKGGSARTVPVTNPVRVLLIDPDTAGASALARAIDMDRELAVVGLCRDPRRVGQEADHCRPDLVAIRLGLDDERCVAVLAYLANSGAKACVIVLGASGDGASAARDAAVMKARIRAVAETNFGIAPEPASPRPMAGSRRLH